MADSPERFAEIGVIHEPRCNTACTPEAHYLTDGIGWPHIHRIDLASVCGECSTSPAAEADDA